MNLFKHRSFAFGCACFLCVLFISEYVSTRARIIIGAIALFVLCLLATLFKITRKRGFKNAFFSLSAMLIMVIIAVLLTVFVMDARLNKASLCDSNEHTVVGKVDKALYKTDHYGIYALDVTTVDGEGNKFKVSLTDDTGMLKENDIICARVTFSKDHPIQLENGITFGASVVEITSSEAGKKDFSDYLRYINKSLDSILCESLNGDTYALMSAMFLGNRENLRPEINRDFTRIGLVHILSLSGMHVSIVVSIIGFFVSKLRLRKWLKMILISLLIFAFLAITGFSETALRAGVMQFVFFGAFFIREKTDGISALFLSVFTICLIDPFSVFSLSLQLSFLAMLGCIASMHFTRRDIGKIRIRPRVVRFCYYTIVTTIFVTAISLPIIATRFGQFSIFSFASNLIITPILNLLIYLAPLMLIASKIPFLSSVVAFACEWICDICLKMSSFASSFKISTMATCTLWQFIGIIIIFLGIVIFICFSKKQTRLALICFGLGVIFFVSASFGIMINRKRNTYISTASSFTNDCVYIESQGELTVVENSSNSLTVSLSLSSLYLLGYTEIENYVACDYSYKSPSYIDSLTSEVVVRNVYLQRPLEEEREWHDEVTSMLKGKGISVKYIDDGFYIDDIRLDFCQSSYLPRSTKRSIAFSIIANNVRITYLGASTYELLDYFPSDYAKTSDFVIFGSYGPSYSILYDYDLESARGYAFYGKSKDFASGNIIENLSELQDISNTKIKIPR